MKHTKRTAALYMRLSRDDELQGESNSISNQRMLLRKVSAEKGYTRYEEYTDDGFSGTNFDRPAFRRMERDIEDGKISALIVKDMSRLGRDYLTVGYYTEHYFPERGIRLIAVNDGVDTDEGENELAPFRNIMNEWYARDASKKVKAAYRARGMAGEPIGLPPYGYKKVEDSKFWEIDEEAASVVCRIYTMALDGMGTEQIATSLMEDKVLNPTSYWQMKGVRRTGSKQVKDVCYWSDSTVAKILERREYMGDVVNFKTSKPSYKSKRRIFNPKDEQTVFEGVHAPIVSREDFASVQKKRAGLRRKKATGRRNIFSGLLRCAECGSNLHFHFSQLNPEIAYFNCPGNNASAFKTCSSTHYVRADFLEQVVLGEIRRIVKVTLADEEAFARKLMEKATAESRRGIELERKRLADLTRRFDEIDLMARRTYEDVALGRITDERMVRLMEGFETDQSRLEEQITDSKAAIAKFEENEVGIEQFLELVRDAKRVKRLSRALLNRFIDHIVIHQAKRTQGKWTQSIDIFYSFVGSVDCACAGTIESPEVSMKVRQGVVLEYAPARSIA